MVEHARIICTNSFQTHWTLQYIHSLQKKPPPIQPPQPQPLLSMDTWAVIRIGVLLVEKAECGIMTIEMAQMKTHLGGG